MKAMIYVIMLCAILVTVSVVVSFSMDNRKSVVHIDHHTCVVYGRGLGQSVSCNWNTK